MKNCKECIHSEVCTAQIPDFMLHSDGMQCQYFADRSEWVHLPCKVGDTAYCNLAHKDADWVDECLVAHIEFDRWWKEPLFTLICAEKADYGTFWLSEFGNEWYLIPTERKRSRKRAKK